MQHSTTVCTRVMCADIATRFWTRLRVGRRYARDLAVRQVRSLFRLTAHVARSVGRIYGH